MIIRWTRHLLTAVTAAALLYSALPAARAADEADKEDKGPVLNVGGLEKEGAGTIKGIVKFDGKKVERKPLVAMAGNAFCNQAHGGNFPPHDRWVFGKNGEQDTLLNVLVYVSKGLEGQKFPATKEKAVLDQHGCIYLPHVLALTVGQPLQILNSDATLHNVFANPTNNDPFNDGMPVAGMKLDKTFKKPELAINLKCAVHPWMGGYIHVLEHPFFAITQEDGTFTIRGLPPGEYEVAVLHEFKLFKPDKETIAVTVGADETKEIEFTYKPPASNP